MSDLITYDDKIRLKSQNVSEKYKVTASDMNEIKSVVNTNAEEVGDTTSLTTTDKTSVVNAVNEINAPEKWVSVGTTAPTDGRRVWFDKGKNLFDGQLELGMYDTITGAKTTNNANYRNVNYINVQPSTTYTFSINGVSQKYILYFYKKDGTFISANVSLTNGTFTTPAETYLLNFRCFNADFTSDYANLKIQLEQGSNATSYEPYIEQSIKVDNEDFISMSNLVSVGNQSSGGKRVWFAKGKNLINLNAITEGKRFIQDGSAYSDASYFITDYISVKPNTTYVVNYTMSAYTRMVFYNSSKTILSVNDTSSIFTTPSNCTYLRLGQSIANENVVQLEERK